ncbi:hypothetical protein, partial [Thermomonas carbonis]
DTAGNSGSSNVVMANIDRTAPVLAPTLPGLILQGGSYTAMANATDALSGIDTASCTPLDTSSAGTRTATCTATDNAGNTATATVSYTVTGLYSFQWQQPLLPVLYQVSPGQRILLQFRLVGSNGWITTLDSATTSSTLITCPSPYAMNLAAYRGSAIDLQHTNNGIYRKTWDAPGIQGGPQLVPGGQRGSCYRMTLDINDGQSHSI